MSTLGAYHDVCEGYDEYNRECSVHSRVTISTLGNTMMSVGIS